MKKIILSMLLLATASFLVAPLAVAQEDLSGRIKGELAPVKNVYDPVADVTPGTLQSTIAKLIRAVLGFLAVIFIVLIVYAGFTWMTAAGNDSKIDQAKSIMSAAIIGVTIIAAAYAITYFVFDVLFSAGSAFSD